MSNEIIIDFCKTEQDAANMFLLRSSDYTLSRRIQNVSYADLNLVINNQDPKYIDTTPDIYSNVSFYEVQIWRLNNV